jgi:hypothetical protein
MNSSDTSAKYSWPRREQKEAIQDSGSPEVVDIFAAVRAVVVVPLALEVPWARRLLRPRCDDVRGVVFATEDPSRLPGRRVPCSSLYEPGMLSALGPVSSFVRRPVGFSCA